jgi:predicted GNAT superfamily acetyltransferase
MSGIEHGRAVHWSDLLAVRADARDRGVGRQLKMFQRDLVRAMGANKMYWSYDPLVARNAYLNIMTLGAYPVEYVRDMYGSDTGSILHRGLGTDRFIVAWMLDGSTSPSPPPSGPLAKSPGQGVRDDVIPPDQVVLLNRANVSTGQLDSRTPPHPVGKTAPLVGVAIPLDIHEVQRTAPEEGIRWRTETRESFQWAFEHGYRVKSFRRVEETQTGLYVLAQRDAGRPGES